MVELADALASGASGSNTVRVQVPPSAPNHNPLFLAADSARSKAPAQLAEQGGYFLSARGVFCL